MIKELMGIHGARVLVTGGSGFIGTNLVQELHEHGCDILNLSLDPPKVSHHFAFYKHCDILDRFLLSSLFAEFKPDFVIHLAARTDLLGSSLLDYQANIQGVRNVVNVVNSISTVRLCLYISSRLVFAVNHIPAHPLDYKPSTLYGESKCHGEQIVLAQSIDSIPWLILRPTSIWGEWFSVPYRNFFDAILKRRYLHPGDSTIMKSFGYVGNTVFQIIRYLLIFSDIPSRQIRFLADYDPIDVLSFANSISFKADLPPVRQVPLSVLKVLAKLGDVANLSGLKNPPLTSFRLSNLVTNMTYDLSQERINCGHLPFTLEDGIARTLSWIGKYG